jgi:hypothetical protein
MSFEPIRRSTGLEDSAQPAEQHGRSSCPRIVELGVGCREGITLNLFEFLGSIIEIWVEILAGRIPPFSCLLAQGDSTSATGWLRKSNFQEHTHRLQLEAC